MSLDESIWKCKEKISLIEREKTEKPHNMLDTLMSASSATERKADIRLASELID